MKNSCAPEIKIINKVTEIVVLIIRNSAERIVLNLIEDQLMRKKQLNYEVVLKKFTKIDTNINLNKEINTLFKKRF
jgi:hypothetical protein